jgi:hypothetical protein
MYRRREPGTATGTEKAAAEIAAGRTRHEEAGWLNGEPWVDILRCLGQIRHGMEIRMVLWA